MAIIATLHLLAWMQAESREGVTTWIASTEARPQAGRAVLPTRETDEPYRSIPAAVENAPGEPGRSLESTFARLAAGADAGDRQASCLLSRALALCEESESLRNEEAHWADVAVQAEQDSPEEGFAISRISEIADLAGNAAVFCKGLSTKRREEAAARMLQAARQGDPQAMAHFALYSRAPDRKSIARKDFDGMYQKHAIEMLERSAASGNLRAMRSLYEVYLHGVSPNRGDSLRVKKDPAAAMAIASVLQRKVGARERNYIAATLGEIEGHGELMASDRFRALLRKYAEYMDEISMRGFDESGRNMDLASCRNFR